MAKTKKVGSLELFKALQGKKSDKEIKGLITKETACAVDPYYTLKPLFWALTYGASSTVVAALLKENPGAANEKHYEGFTPLHYAEKLDLATAKLLLDACPGAVAVPDSNGKLPLHWACEGGAQVDVVSLLLKADPSTACVKDNHDRIPYQVARDSYASDEILDMLHEANPKGADAVPEADDKLPCALLFPGSGSQYVGMLKEAKDMPKVKAMLKEAQQILGYDLLKYCLQGPEDILHNPLYSHPIVYVAGLAAVEKMKVENPQMFRRATALAGLDVGEYVALCVAGVVTFSQGLELVKERITAMTDAANSCPQAMLSVAGLDDAKLLQICQQAIEKVGGEDSKEICQISNSLFQKGFTVGGTKAAVEECQAQAQAAKAIQARLIKSSGAFHTTLMRPARLRYQAALFPTMVKTMKSPRRYKVYMNLNAQPIDYKTPPEYIAGMLAHQVTSQVLWKDVVQQMIEDGITSFHEVGPMKQLKQMMKRIDNDAFSSTQNTEV